MFRKLPGGGAQNRAFLTLDTCAVRRLCAAALLLWRDFVRPDELAFLLDLVYGSAGADEFGTQFVREGSSDEESEESEVEDDDDESGSDSDGSGGGLSPEVAAMVAAALATRGGGGARGKGGVTKNRLRTSHFLRRVWWRGGEGRRVFEALAARAAVALGLPPGCAEAPQVQ